MSRRKAALPHRIPILFPAEESERPGPLSPAHGAGMRGAGDLGADEFEDDDDGFAADLGPDLGSRPH